MVAEEKIMDKVHMCQPGVVHVWLYVFIHHLMKSALKKISTLQTKQCDLCTRGGAIQETFYAFIHQY